MSRFLLMVVLAVFGVYSLYAVYEVGYLGIFASHGHVAGMQVLADLVIALSLVMVWMVNDARAKGRNPWPYVIATLALGSLGPLCYLLFARTESRNMG